VWSSNNYKKSSENLHCGSVQLCFDVQNSTIKMIVEELARASLLTEIKFGSSITTDTDRDPSSIKFWNGEALYYYDRVLTYPLSLCQWQFP
jgi:hypothetical protein